ncbi:dihydroxyacetone kinase family protein [Bifidobacterium sp. ESL0763]|uniref:dihydroxyacetone kinase family protein n=1 Tax=Bifidobacterium sp. ESL0763 TaxID=2983227 RepID=UPI0023F67B92|nr:dihydroxyacetone kinase family protein [Bifidobacterium sp. ESL0763]MDF7664179.1 dihydroxyacetone kinase family protein [Bifidobacterium sp. ESL0763]
MTVLVNDPERFAQEAAEGFVAANRQYVNRCYGGVVRATKSAQPQTAVVIGGGSGHYPMFNGYVGPGLAHGAVMGNIFASPAASEVVSVCRAADQGRGVLLLFGNYAGDVLNFTEGAEQLHEEGIDVRLLPISDDIYSAPADKYLERRGIAGDLTVIKSACAAAAAGADLDEVERVAKEANERTRSIGVAFSGCTLPGAKEPLFEVPDGRMGVGLGIHGEPGIDETDMPTADGLAEMMVDALMKDRPASAKDAKPSILPMVNGLGSLKTEGLFVIYRKVASLLESKGVRIVDPQVGEFCTSFDMCGVSLTFFWLDDELEKLWGAPADSPAFKCGQLDTGSQVRVSQDEVSQKADGRPEVEEASEDSKASAKRLAAMMRTVADTIDAKADELGRIDSIAGDGDHGIGMKRGADAAADAAESEVEKEAGVSTTLRCAAQWWADKAGGTSGALWGAMLKGLAGKLSDQSQPSADDIKQGVSKACESIMAVGKAKVGDKTMVDAIVPFTKTLNDATGSFADAWEQAADAACKAADDTKSLLPRMGRAKTHGERDLGTPDPGAVSFSYIVRSLVPAFRSHPVD